MFGILSHIGPEVPITLLLVAMMALRTEVRPRVSLHIKASADKLWNILRPHDGKVDNWGQVRVSTQLVVPEDQVYESTYSMLTPSGVARSFQARFRLVEAIPGRSVVLRRVGLEGRQTSNELLEIRHQIEPEGDGVRLRTSYHWGKRLLMGQLLARTDLWGGIYRTKSLAETGQASNRAYALISGLVALGTAIASIAAFALLVPWWYALVVVFILLVHEFGHLLAFRMIGQPWGRLVFLPFLGAMAVPRLPYQSQAESVFAALMGPGFSCLLAIGCLIPAILHWPGQQAWYVVGAVTAGLNAFNMLPAEPLDGGVALRSVASRVIGNSAWAGLIGVGLIIVAVGYVLGNFAFMLFGGLAVVANFRRRKIDTGLAPLTSLQVCIAFFAYMSITAAHFTLLAHFMMQLGAGHGA